MTIFGIKIKRKMNFRGEYVDGGLSVQINRMFPNPFDGMDKIHKAIFRVRGIDF